MQADVVEPRYYFPLTTLQGQVNRPVPKGFASFWMFFACFVQSNGRFREKMSYLSSAFRWYLSLPY